MKKAILLVFIFSIPFSGFCKSRIIHVFVALCDNANQGIVPVPASIGNGQNPSTNLYWGAMYGVKTYFSKSKNWSLASTIKNPRAGILERCIFKNTSSDVYIIADAYDGKFIRQTIENFFTACSGKKPEKLNVNDLEIEAGGKSDLLCYVGHDGLMEFTIDNYPKGDSTGKKAIILACGSHGYFNEGLQKSGAYPLVWTNGLMAPEAYTLEAAINAWVANDSNDKIVLAAAQAYAKYQKSGLDFARWLLTTGW